MFRPIGWEEFVANTARLENLPELAPQSAFVLELLRDGVELKKLNNHLMKVAPLEDLVADIYSRLYQMNLPQLAAQVNEENKEKMRVDHILMASDGAADTPTPPTSGPTSEAPAPRGRTKGIARRDVQKRAETIVARRAAARPPPTTTAKPATEPAAQPPVPTSMPESLSAPNNPPAETEATRDPAEEPVSAPHSDIPGSLHESGDYESDVSEVEDEKLTKRSKECPMSNLADGGHGEPGSEMSGHVSFDGGDAEGGDREAEDDREEAIDTGGGEDETMEEAGDEGEGDGDVEGEAEAEAEAEGEGEGEGDKEEAVDVAGPDEDEAMGEGDEEAEADETEIQEGAEDADPAHEGDTVQEGEEHEGETVAEGVDPKDTETTGEDVEPEQPELPAGTDEKADGDPGEKEPHEMDAHTHAQESDV